MIDRLKLVLINILIGSVMGFWLASGMFGIFAATNVSSIICSSVTIVGSIAFTGVWFVLSVESETYTCCWM